MYAWRLHGILTGACTEAFTDSRHCLSSPNDLPSGDMRYLLYIPCLMLFFANVPFVQMIQVEKHGQCLKKQEGRGKYCKRGQGHRYRYAAAHNDQHGPFAPKGRCKRAGADCIGICFYQFASTTQDLSSFQFAPWVTHKCETGYITKELFDPHKAPPWEPPDMV